MAPIPGQNQSEIRAGRHKSLASCAAFKDFSFRTCYADVSGVAVKEDRSVVVGERHLGGDSSLVLVELHTVNLLNRTVEGQRRVVQLHHSRETK